MLFVCSSTTIALLLKLEQMYMQVLLKCHLVTLTISFSYFKNHKLQKKILTIHSTFFSIAIATKWVIYNYMHLVAIQ